MRSCVLSFVHHARAAQLRQRRANPNPPTDGAAVNRHQVPEGWTIQAYRFALDPTPTQARAMASHVGAARFVYNWGLGLVQSRLHERRRLGEQALVEGPSEHA